jgi:hypothetical protein
MKRKEIKIPPQWWKLNGLPTPETEFKFHPTKKWRFDYCFTYYRVAIEVEGGIFSNGRHVRGIGYARDMEKYNAAALLGYRILRYQPNKIDCAEIRTMLGFIRSGEI